MLKKLNISNLKLKDDFLKIVLMKDNSIYKLLYISILTQYRHYTENFHVTSGIVLAPSQWDCNFESGLCTWTQAKDDQFDWTRVRGSTGTLNTGPTSDHTTGSGYYIYIETSSPRRVNDTARIISQPINVNTTMCLSFWYHMYGTSVRTLNVYTKVGGSLSPPVWSRTGTRSNKWYQASVDVQSSRSYQIVFEGVRGTSYRGDIALDDISVSMGSCSGNH